MGFIFIFFGLYAAMNGYVFWKVCLAFPNMGHWRWALAGLFAAMVLAPLYVRLLDAAGHLRLAGVLGMVGYIWLAVVFWLLLLYVLADVWNGAARLVSLAAPSAKRLVVPPRVRFFAFSGVAAAALAWGFVEASRIRLREVTVRVGRLPAGRRTLRIAQVTDMHLGLHTGRRRLRRAVRLIERARPDLIVSTGDLVDSPLSHAAPLADELRRLDAPLGKLAVLGNHEFYTGLDDSLAFHEAAGFRVLREQAVEPLEGLRIAGVDDPAGLYRGSDSRMDEDAVLAKTNPRPVTILLKHQPTVRASSVGRFDLQLSGHTHGGQIFPFHFVLLWRYGRWPGLHELGKGSRLYLSRGAGTWGPPLRVLSPPEVTLITLVAEEPVSD